MTTLTIWKNKATSEIMLVQLSDDPKDGTADEQIDRLASIAFYADHECVSKNYTGPVPQTEASLWRWGEGGIITSRQEVPASITPRQCRLILLNQGLLAQVEAMIAQQDEATKITWEFASEFRRDDPLLAALGAGLGLTTEQIDQFFIAAAAL